MSQGDGVDEAIERAVRATVTIAVTAAGRLGEIAAREREQRARLLQAAAEHEAAELTGRWESERAGARAQLSAVEQPGWWDRATATEIAAVWQTAREWESFDESAGEARNVISREVEDRFDINLDGLTTSPKSENVETAAVAARAEYEELAAAALVVDADRADVRAVSTAQRLHVESYPVAPADVTRTTPTRAPRRGRNARVQQRQRER